MWIRQDAWGQLSSASATLSPILLDAALKGLALLALTGLVTLAMRRSSAAARHLIWFLGIVSLLILPILSATLPAWHILPGWTMSIAPAAEVPPTPSLADLPAPLADAQEVPPVPSLAVLPTPQPAASPSSSRSNRDRPDIVGIAPSLPPPASSSSLPWRSWLLIAWLGGTSVLLAKIVLGFLALRWLEHRSSPLADPSWFALLQKLSRELGLRRPVELLTHPAKTMPMTWGVWKTRLLLPAESMTWPVDQRRAVLLHELAHARRWDCLTQLVTQFACAVYWFHPLIWLGWHCMQTERERACDDLVLSTGAKASAYAEQLLHIASDMPTLRFSAAAIAMARPSSLEGRLLAILDVTRNRCAITWSMAVLAALLLGGLAVSLAIVQAESIGPDAPANQPLAQGADELADRFTSALARQNLPFLDKQKLADLRARLRQFAADRLPEKLPADRQHALLQAIDQYVEVNFRTPADADSLSRLYLRFPDAVMTFQWQLWLVAHREPLNLEQEAQRQAQHQWVRQFIRSLPSKQGRTHAEVLASMEESLVDPLDVLFSTPMDPAMFQRFKQTMQGDSVAHDLAFAKAHCVSSAMNLRYRTVESFSLPFQDRLVTWGQASGRVELSFASNQSYAGQMLAVDDVETSREILDVLEPSLLRFPADVKGESGLDRWLAQQGRGHVGYDDANGGGLFGVRGTKLLELTVHTWMDADQLTASDLQALLQQKGQHVVSLVELQKGHQADPWAQSFVGVLTGDGKLAVVSVSLPVGPGSGVLLHARPRPPASAPVRPWLRAKPVYQLGERVVLRMGWPTSKWSASATDAKWDSYVRYDGRDYHCGYAIYPAVSGADLDLGTVQSLKEAWRPGRHRIAYVLKDVGLISGDGPQVLRLPEIASNDVEFEISATPSSKPSTKPAAAQPHATVQAMSSFLAALKKEDFTAAARFVLPKSGLAGELTDFRGLAGVQELQLANVWADDAAALAVTTALPGESGGPIVFRLQHQKDQWIITNGDTRSPDEAKAQAQEFVKRHPQAQAAPIPTIAPATHPATTRVATDQPIKLTDAQLRQALTLRENQMKYTWNGDHERSVSPNGHSVAGNHALEPKGGSISRALGQAMDRADEDPRVFLPMLDHDDTDAVLTAMWLMDKWNWHRNHPGTSPATRDTVAALARELRQKSLGHTDARIRWMAMYLLDRFDCGTVEDVNKGFADTSTAVREETSWVLFDVRNQMARPGDMAFYDANNDLKRQLVPVLMKHLRSDDFFVRVSARQCLDQILIRHEPVDARGYRQLDPPGMPPEIAWATADWELRNASQKAWSDWWEKHGEEAIRFSDQRPPASTRPTIPPATQPAAIRIGQIDLSKAPLITTDTHNLPDLWEQRPSGSGSYALRPSVVVSRHPTLWMTTDIYHVPAKGLFYVQHDPACSSRMTFYGPFTGDPAVLLAMGPAAAATQPAQASTVGDILASLKSELVKISKDYPELAGVADRQLDVDAQAGLWSLSFFHNCEDQGKQGYEDTGPNPAAVSFRITTAARYQWELANTEMQMPPHEVRNRRLIVDDRVYVGKAPTTPGFESAVRALLAQHVAMVDALERTMPAATQPVTRPTRLSWQSTAKDH